MSMRSADPEAGTIDYRLNILGIRVSEHGCQLVAKGGDGEWWNTIGPCRDLPVHIPETPEELEAAVLDTLRLMAYQYNAECPGSDLAAVLSKRLVFAAALQHLPGGGGESVQILKRTEPR